MQGMFVGDADTPPARLERFLRHRLGTPVSILNTGHLGYSPEQYYYTLAAYADRFRPQFVVLSVFANDFGDLYDVVTKGEGDWDEARYWVGEVVRFCRSRGLLCLVVPVPWEGHVKGGRRLAGYYPGRFADVAQVSPAYYCNPIEDFVEADLRLTDERRSRSEPVLSSPLYNGHISDGHFSPEGSDVWARAVGRRLALLLEHWRDNGRVRF
jgi:hypothetical protein